jgi:hypothetical protein
MLRKLIALPIVATLLGILVSAHWYLADRLILAPGLPEPWASGLLVAVGVMAASLLMQPVGERLLSRPWRQCIAWPASLWMGLAFYLIIPLALSDGLLALGGWASGDAEGATLDVARVRAAGVVGLALVAVSMGLRRGLARPALKRVEVRLARWPRALDGFRVLQISDIHIGPILGPDFASWLTEQVNAREPDLVAITGDLVDGSAARLAHEVAPFGALRAKHGVYFVTGNHDHYSGADSWTKVIGDLGIRVLRNERVALEVEGASGRETIELAGVDDHRGGMLPGSGGEDLHRALEGVDPSRPLVLLAHDPSTFKRASEMGVDLQLSGHTHGGQIWPFEYMVRLAIPWVAGLHRLGRATLYVSRGTGFWGPPMRVRAPAEITELVLRPTDPAEAAR